MKIIIKHSFFLFVDGEMLEEITYIAFQQTIRQTCNMLSVLLVADEQSHTVGDPTVKGLRLSMAQIMLPLQPGIRTLFPRQAPLPCVSNLRAISYFFHDYSL